MFRKLLLIFAFGSLASLSFGQSAASSPYRSQELSDGDQIPVLLKNLPRWESVRSAAVITNRAADLAPVIGAQPIVSVIEFVPGTEAAAAVYPEGKLLLVEYVSPRTATEENGRFQEFLAANPSDTTVYRRIGNYSAFVFDSPDTATANALLDEITYGKTVVWLGEDPFLLKRIERYIAVTGRDVALSTVLFIIAVLVTAIVLGILTGLAYYRIRERQRASMRAFSDAGGLTRLNLDELAEPLQLVE